jgi:hypothetical protein
MLGLLAFCLISMIVQGIRIGFSLYSLLLDLFILNGLIFIRLSPSLKKYLVFWNLDLKNLFALFGN